MDNATLQRLSLLEKAQQLCNSGCWQWLPKEECFFGSEALFRLFGLPVSQDRLIPLSYVNTKVHPSDSLLAQKKWEDLKTGISLDFILQIVAENGETRQLHLISERIVAENGETITQGCCKDVTQEKETIAVLKEYAADLEHQLKTFYRAEQVALSGTWQVNLENHQTWYSDNVYRLHGVPPQTLPPHLGTFSSFIYSEDKEVVSKATELAYSHKVPLHLEYRITRNDGEVRYLRLVSEVTKSVDGEELLTGISQDITEQKQLELQLRNSNESLDIQNKHFRHTEQISKTGTWQVNLETRVAYYSDNLYRLYGLKPGSIDKGLESFLQFVYSEDRAKVTEAHQKAYEEQLLPNIDFRIIRHDGKLRYFSQTATLVKNTDNEPVMIGVVQDITDQQLLGGQLEKLNKELTIQNEAFTQAEQTANIGTWRWNLDTNDIFYSDNVYRIYGLKPQSVKPGYEAFHQYFHPDDLLRIKEIPGIMQKRGEPVQVDYRIYRADGELRYLRGRNKIYISEAGERILIGTTQDVTEEVLLQQKLDEQIRFVGLLSDNLVDQLVVTNTSNVIVEFNKAAETIQGVSRSSVIGKNFFEAFPHSRVPQLTDNLKRALKGELIREANIPSALAKGYVERYHIPVKDEHEKVVGVLTLIRDVTEELTLRHQLQNKLGFIENLVDASVTRIIALDKNLNYTLWNKKAEEYYGLTRENMIGRSILQFYPSLKKEPIYDNIKRCLAGEAVYIPPNETEKEGYHEAHLIPLKDEGNVTGLLWMITDLSERKETEQKILESRNLLQQITEATPDAITIYEVDSKELIYFNDRLADWIGVSSQTLADMGTEGRLQLIHPDDRKRLLEFNAGYTNTSDEETRSLEYRLLTKKRNYIWIRNRGKVFKRNKQGRVTHIVSILQDITEQKVAEQEILRLKEVAIQERFRSSL